MTLARCHHCKNRIQWEYPKGLWDDLKGQPAWMIGRCPWCGKVLLDLLNTQFWGDVSGTLMIKLEQGDDFVKMIPWERVMQSKFYLKVEKRDGPVQPHEPEYLEKIL